MNHGARMGTQLAGLVGGEYPPTKLAAAQEKMGELGELARPRLINENG
jgi:hypothetical protein